MAEDNADQRLEQSTPTNAAEPFDQTDNIDSIERLSSMSREEVDDLPYGFIVLDPEGQVLLYNRYEARMSRIAPERVVGQNFFRDIAPCTRVEAFYGRFRALVADPTRESERFAFRFHFLHGAQNVIVQFARAPEAGFDAESADGVPLGRARVFMTVTRRVLSEANSLRAPQSISLDAERGMVTGPLGPAFPILGVQLPSILRWLGPAATREVGREFGIAIAALASETARRVGEPLLKDAPVLLIAGALDEAMARAGLGRLALDLTPQGEIGVIGCFLRSPLEMPSRAFATLYEGMLEAALGEALETSFVARCIDNRDLHVAPWRFALAPVEKAAVLERRPDERTSDLARRLGLFTDEEL